MSKTLEEAMADPSFNVNDAWSFLDEFHDPKTYELLGTGKCIGVFQLETPLGRQFTRKLKPENLDHIAALAAVLRPGAMQMKLEDGASATEHYIRRKNKEEEVVYFHPALEHILNDTFGLCLFQEQQCDIAREIAGFDLLEADMLRKSTSKKLPEEMAKILKLFVDKSEAKGIVTREEAQRIADDIKESARYAFNASHSYSYGAVSRACAYLKANYTKLFMKAWMRNSDNSPDPKEDIKQLIKDAAFFSVNVYPPSILKSHDLFEIVDGDIYFGLYNIAGVGHSHISKIRAAISHLESVTGLLLRDISWYQFLVIAASKGEHPTIPVSVLDKLIGAGALDYLKVGRRKMSHELKNWDSLSPGEHKWAYEHYTEYNSLISLLEAMGRLKKEGGAAHNANRVSQILSVKDLIENPPCSLADSADSIIASEEALLGVNITCSRLDKFDTSYINATLRQVVDAKNLPKNIFIGVEVTRMNRYKLTKGASEGREMGFLNLEDKTCSLDGCVIFPEALEEYGEYLYEGATVLLQCEKDQKKGSLIIQKAYPLRK
jgi:DNA polymerase III alpha subunit